MTGSTPQGIPAGFELMRTTETFDHESVPAGLLRAHRVADGVWGRLVVHAGSVTFMFEDDSANPHLLNAGESVVIPPARLHHVEPSMSAKFAVEFYRGPAGAVSTSGI